LGLKRNGFYFGEGAGSQEEVWAMEFCVLTKKGFPSGEGERSFGFFLRERDFPHEEGGEVVLGKS
jgi:hypothetical protein